MKTKKITTYQKFIVVEGSGSFPVDMLRYDSAFPATEIDSSLVEDHHEHRAVALIVRSLNNLGPTEARWESFTWKVVGIFQEMYDATDLRDALRGKT